MRANLSTSKHEDLPGGDRVGRILNPLAPLSFNCRNLATYDLCIAEVRFVEAIVAKYCFFRRVTVNGAITRKKGAKGVDRPPLKPVQFTESKETFVEMYKQRKISPGVYYVASNNE